MDPTDVSPAAPASEPVVPPAPEADGVSNGDVDWLFRGKLKKIKKAEDRKEEKRAEAASSGAPATTKPEPAPPAKPAAPPAPAKPALPAAKPASPPQKPATPSPPPQQPPATQSPAQPLKNKHVSLKLEKFKFGRSRLLLLALATAPVAPTTPAAAPAPQKRRGLINLGSLKHENPANNSGNESPLGLAPPLRSNSMSKRGLFSLISLKLKAASAYQPPGSPVKLDQMLMGLGGYYSPGNSQDLLLLDKPPVGMGAGTGGRRRGSLVLSALSGGSSSSSPAPAKRVVLNKNPNREKLAAFSGIPLERVTFAIDQLAYDPQQQIPLRRPKKGNVLVPEDLVAPPPRLLMGISLSDGGKLAQEAHYLERELLLAIESQRRALVEADKHALEAHVVAKKLALEVCGFKSKHGSATVALELEDEEGTLVDQKAGNLEIEKPMHHHEAHFGAEEVTTPTSDDGTADASQLLLETIYTRCCHLREILPIPATLKQLKGKLKPLQVLKMLNPKPTLIDVLLFADFIAITPINTVIFDNVTMTLEMLKHFLALLVHNHLLEKLLLRNVAVDAAGWRMLCKFLASNRTVKKLDISQQKVKSDTAPGSVRNRMDWDLMTSAIEARGGIEEFVMNGCKLPDATFALLIRRAVLLLTFRLGIAATELNVAKAEAVAEWVGSPSTKCIGIDIAFNDLTQGQLAPFARAFALGNAKLIFLSLNLTGLHDVDSTADFLEAVGKIPTLRFLDLLLVPEVFPGLITRLATILPKYPLLKRIHFDLDELLLHSIGAIADILPKIPGLVHVSLLGNGKIMPGAAGALYQTVKHLQLIHTLDMDSDQVPEELSQKIAFYLMRNLDHTYNREMHPDGDEELIFDGRLLMEAAEKLMTELESADAPIEDPKVQKMITNALIERTRAVRTDLHSQIDRLFAKRREGTLLFDGKERLLRLCLLDSSLEKVVNMFEDYAINHGYLLRTVLPPDAGSLARQAPTSEEVAKALARLTLPPLITLHSRARDVVTMGPITAPLWNNGIAPPPANPPTAATFTPHQVVTECDNGQLLTVDGATGRPVLMRLLLQTLSHGRELELEEGEIHKLGVYMREHEHPDKNELKVPMLSTIPLGLQLRDAIIAAKGIELVTDLIDRISTDHPNFVYTQGGDLPTLPSTKTQAALPDDNIDEGSIDLADPPVPSQVAHVYDKLLNEAQRVRSNKQ